MFCGHQECRLFALCEKALVSEKLKRGISLMLGCYRERVILAVLNVVANTVHRMDFDHL